MTKSNIWNKFSTIRLGRNISTEYLYTIKVAESNNVIIFDMWRPLAAKTCSGETSQCKKAVNYLKMVTDRQNSSVKYNVEIYSHWWRKKCYQMPHGAQNYFLFISHQENRQKFPNDKRYRAYVNGPLVGNPYGPIDQLAAETPSGVIAYIKSWLLSPSKG